MRALIVLLITAWMATLLAGCSTGRAIETLAAAPENSGQLKATLTPVQDGRQIFMANCASCHGKNADGNTPAGKQWRIPDLRSPQVQSLSNEQLTQILKQGKGKMPAWSGLLSAADLEHTLEYIRSLKKQ